MTLTTQLSKIMQITDNDGNSHVIYKGTHNKYHQYVCINETTGQSVVLYPTSLECYVHEMVINNEVDMRLLEYIQDHMSAIEILFSAYVTEFWLEYVCYNFSVEKARTFVTEALRKNSKLSKSWLVTLDMKEDLQDLATDYRKQTRTMQIEIMKK